MGSSVACSAAQSAHHAQSGAHWRALRMPFGMCPALGLLRFATEFLIVLQPAVLKLCVCVYRHCNTHLAQRACAPLLRMEPALPEGSRPSRAGRRDHSDGIWRCAQTTRLLIRKSGGLCSTVVGVVCGSSSIGVSVVGWRAQALMPHYGPSLFLQ